ncbi:cupin domain-containing protein [cf. Phormidesmis sp. LEGE 11477]|uniref:cupin domain-containing protein n=1 Tax=cf. Phormidesmis sp. LEGE 11477 TaxID=1828680 RepID=UPI001881F2F9|nr:cupin domain-containing protein [cf. Phormidesmis sp. LEGE 11477]MBE9061848.1 cupin domain-containing protein [cf. Phormidesmis sp. LEGE 11477]
MKIDLSAVPIEIGTNYPASFRSAVKGRSRQRVGNAAGLTNFGVNLTTLAPGGQSALRHWHSVQDEFVYVTQGELVLVTDAGEQVLKAGEMAGFAAGVNNGHHLINRSSGPATYLEIGDRTAPDQVDYPDQDLQCVPSDKGDRVFIHKDGRPY